MLKKGVTPARVETIGLHALGHRSYHGSSKFLAIENQPTVDIAPEHNCEM